MREARLQGRIGGSAMLDCGERTDVITGGDKLQGISILVRTFAPRVIAIDEIGKSADAEAIFHAGVCGCSILATIHGSSIEDIQHKSEMERIFQSELIDRFVVLSMDEKWFGILRFMTERGIKYVAEIYCRCLRDDRSTWIWLVALR